MQEKSYTIELNYLELSMLDGKVHQKAQEVIDRAKQEWELGGGVLGEFLRKAIEQHSLIWILSRINYCSRCKKSAGYVLYERTSINHRKGDPNKDRPKTMKGINFNSTDNGRGICEDCAGGEATIRKAIDFIINGDYPVEIQPNSYRYSKYELMRTYTCKDCGNDYIIDKQHNNVVGGRCTCGKTMLSFTDKRKQDTITLSPLYQKERIEMVLTMAVEALIPGKTRLARINNTGSLGIFGRNKDAALGYIDMRKMTYSVGEPNIIDTSEVIRTVGNWMDTALPDIGFRKESFRWR